MIRLISTWMLLCPGLAQAQSLDMVGSCPGPVELSVTGLTPGGNFILLVGDAVGAGTISGGPCDGSAIGFESLVKFFGPITDVDGDGMFTATPSVPARACEVGFQVIDLETCDTSEVTAIGPAPVLGNVLYAADGRGSRSFAGPGGFYRIDLDAGSVDTVTTMDRLLTGLSFGPDGLLYAVEAEGRNYPSFFIVAPETGDLLELSESTDPGSISAFAWVGDILYGWTETGDLLTIIDPLTGEVTIPGFSQSTGNNCFAASRDGDLFMIRRAETYLIDPVAGSSTYLGNVTGLSGTDAGAGCTFHDDELYISTGLAHDLYVVDLATLAATFTGISLGDNIDALASPTP